MKETKKMQIMPQDEERIINAYACFGWEVTSSQEVKVKDSHLEAGLFTGSVYSVTESENYVNLILSRDTSMPHYQSLCKCQQVYENAQSKLEPTKKIKLIYFVIWPLLLLTKSKNKQIEENNDKLFATMEKALNKARTLMNAQ